MTCSLAHTYKC